MRLDVLAITIAACMIVETIKAEEKDTYTYIPNPFLDPDAVEIDPNQQLMPGVDIYLSRPKRKPKDVPANYVLVEVYARCARCTYQQEWSLSAGNTSMRSGSAGCIALIKAAACEMNLGRYPT
jgi:hypothetical protein